LPSLKNAFHPNFMSLNSSQQTTLARQAGLEGKGLHTGVPARLTMLPAPADHGVVFKRVDLPGTPSVKADLANVTATERGTVVTSGEASAATIEHFMGALYGLGIDNVLVELSGPEVPIVDGSAMEYVKLIQSAGTTLLDQTRHYLDITDAFEISDGAKKIVARPAAELEVLYRIDYHHPHLGQQQVHFFVTSDNFAESIAPARTFCFEFEIEAMRKAGLIKGGGADCALVIGEHGLVSPPLRFPDEYVRHKVLDFLGDLSLCGAHVRGAFEIDRAGHRFHIDAVKALRHKFIKSVRSKPVSEAQIPSASTAVHLDVIQIQALLPHRYPMLLVDRVIALDFKKCITGIKNVTMNEHFFQGHFPGAPIMPGVLIIEGLAQCGGILIMKSYPELVGKLTYFMAIDNARFRRPVVPGDQLRYEVEIQKVKGPVTRFKAMAYVGTELAAEAELMCMVADKK
jgi:UDP-3-O-[3-hydroxymyristoyl] N-acetylglucosamine deacetylase / 3-hydroxyacyl-[acyl-carrier-protein] dehydratase